VNKKGSFAVLTEGRFSTLMQLLYPEFLWGLLAVAIPIAIHLLQMRRPQRVLFTNTGFIREVELTTMRRRQLQELLVLVMRILAVIFLVLIFCQPFIPIAKDRVHAEAGSVGVLIDNSGSMQATGQSQPQLLQEALAGATTLGKSYGTGTYFKLLNQGARLLNREAYEQAVAAEPIGGQQSGWGSIGVREALQNEQLGTLYLFSDFQKNEVASNFWQRVRQNREIVLVPQVARPTSNIYVDSVWLNDAFVRARTNVTMHMRLRNGGTQAIADCPVKVLLGKQQVATFRVSLAVGQTSEMMTQVLLADDKLTTGQVVTGDSPVTFDNTYYFTMQPAAAIHIVEIGQEPVAQRAYAGETLFRYLFYKPQAINYSELRQANLVLLREVNQVDAGLREALASVVRGGGSVVVVPTADPAAHASYQELFRALGVGGEQWEAPATGVPVRQEVAMPSPRAPFFKDVFGAQPRQVAMPQVAPILRLGRGGTDIMRLRDGDSYLTEFASGAGHTYIFTAPFTKSYSDFAEHALFIPVLYRLAILSYHTDQQVAYRMTIPTISLTVPATAAHDAHDAASYRLVHDSLTYIPAQRVQGGQLRLDVPTALHTPGFYELTRQGKVVTTLAFNADKRESDLAAYSAAELRQLLGANHPNVRVLEGNTQPEAIARYRAGQAGQPLWRYCLLAVLACLLVEALLLRFGRSRTGASLAAA
jgi:hypothetical protein